MCRTFVIVLLMVVAISSRPSEKYIDAINNLDSFRIAMAKLALILDLSHPQEIPPLYLEQVLGLVLGESFIKNHLATLQQKIDSLDRTNKLLVNSPLEDARHISEKQLDALWDFKRAIERETNAYRMKGNSSTTRVITFLGKIKKETDNVISSRWSYNDDNPTISKDALNLELLTGLVTQMETWRDLRDDLVQVISLRDSIALAGATDN